FVERDRRRHRRQRVEPHPLEAPRPRFFDDPHREQASEVPAAERGADVEALHLADAALAERMQGYAAGRRIAVACEEDRVVVAGQRGQLRVEVLEREVDAERGRVLREELADGRHLRCAIDLDHTASSPRSTVTARPPSFTRSPSSRTRTTPPRAEAW